MNFIIKLFKPFKKLFKRDSDVSAVTVNQLFSGEQGYGRHISSVELSERFKHRFPDSK